MNEHSEIEAVSASADATVGAAPSPAPEAAAAATNAGKPAPERRQRRTATPSPEVKEGRRARPQPKRALSEIAEFTTWLGSLELGITPAVHVNGPAYTNCVLAVDFGTPKKVVRLTNDQSIDLVTRMRTITRSVMNREVKVGVQADHSHGIWWSSIS
jgi:hypothetical protein